MEGEEGLQERGKRWGLPKHPALALATPNGKFCANSLIVNIKSPASLAFNDSMTAVATANIFEILL